MTEQYEYPETEPLGLTAPNTSSADRQWIAEPGIYEANLIKIKDLTDSEQIQLIFHTTDDQFVYQEKFKKSRNELANLISGLGLDPMTATPQQLKAKPMRLFIELDQGGYKHLARLEWLASPNAKHPPLPPRPPRADSNEDVPF